MFNDIFVTALEGGINYWASCSAYKWSLPDGSADPEGFFADIIDCVVEGRQHPLTQEVEAWRIDIDTIRRGLELAPTAKVYWSITPPPTLRAIEAGEEWEDFDAGDADMIVQLGLFGEVRYG